MGAASSNCAGGRGRHNGVSSFGNGETCFERSSVTSSSRSRVVRTGPAMSASAASCGGSFVAAFSADLAFSFAALIHVSLPSTWWPRTAQLSHLAQRGP
eukprot:6879955-Prymnesium_polylepis.1